MSGYFVFYPTESGMLPDSFSMLVQSWANIHWSHCLIMFVKFFLHMHIHVSGMQFHLDADYTYVTHKEAYTFLMK